MFKLGHCVDGVWTAYSHPALFVPIRMETGATKLISTVPGSDPIVLMELVNRLHAPLMLLYVLHTPRGEGKAGRYQSGEIDYSAFRQFMSRFGDFLKSDARFDLWVHSPADRATIIWDRHDLLYIYGITDPAIAALRSLGFEPGRPTINFEHQHHYHEKNDEHARALLSAIEWQWSPLRPQDEQ